MAFDFERLYPYTDEEAVSAFYEIWITRQGGGYPVMEFASGLDSETYWRLRNLLVKTATQGKIRNNQMYRHIDEGVYEFKARTARVYSFDDGRRVVLTHGGWHTDRAAEQRRKAVAVRTEYVAWKGRTR